MMGLLIPVNCRFGGGAFQGSVRLAGNGALGAAADLTLALAWATRRLVEARVGPWWTWRGTTMACRARFPCRSRPGLRRWRSTWPETPGPGPPQPASPRRPRSGTGQDATSWPAPGRR
jgi:hypothetical protein